MKKKADPPFTVDDYIGGFPEPVRQKLEAVRKAIRAAVPEAVEKISYRMPAFDYQGILVYFAAFSDHISFFPTAEGIEAFREELGPHVKAKGTVHFSLDEELPLDLMARIARHRAAQNKLASEHKRPAKQ
jgi:uncharacterized protein YdhG (YjbR/CyaY superfamily)